MQTILCLQVLEKGNGYLSLSLKGLELQETSCHSLEATRLDDIFDATFEKQRHATNNTPMRNATTNPFNYFLFHTLTPLTSLSVPLYVESRSVLNDLFEGSRILELVTASFVEALVWLLVDFAKKHRHVEKRERVVEVNADVVVAIDASSTGERVDAVVKSVSF